MTGRLRRWLARPWSGLREARSELAKSEADRAGVQSLGADLDELHRENHITARVHRAVRGGRQRP